MFGAQSLHLAAQGHISSIVRAVPQAPSYAIGDERKAKRHAKCGARRATIARARHGPIDGIAGPDDGVGDPNRVANPDGKS